MGSSLQKILEKKLATQKKNSLLILENSKNGTPSAQILSKREGYILVYYNLRGYNDTGQLLINTGR